MTITRRSTLAEVASAVSAALDAAGISAVLTGGACAAIYSGGAYQSADLDFIVQSGGTRRSLDAAMSAIGFRRDGDRYVHGATTFFVDFPRGPLAIGDDIAIRPVRVRTGSGRVLSLSATDTCRDRLAAFYHWSDRQSLAAALAIAARHRVNMKRIKEWSDGEDAGDKFEEFRRAASRT